MASLYKRGNQFWVCYYVDGKRIQRSLKTKNQWVAKRHIKRIEYELAMADLHQTSNIPLFIILEEFCQYLQSTRTFKSYKNEISRLRIFFGPMCKSLKQVSSRPARQGRSQWKDKYNQVHIQVHFLEELSGPLIQRFLLDRIETDHWSFKYANLMREVLHKLFSYAIAHYEFHSKDPVFLNPVDGVERFQESTHEVRFLNFTEISFQLEALVEHPTLYGLVATYIYAGLRREEALWLTPSDVDLEQRLIRIRTKTVNGEYWQPKTKRNRVVPISNSLYSILCHYHRLKNCPWFFPSHQGKRWDPDNFSRKLRKVNQKTGLTWTCQNFRHTFGSQLAQKGESLYKISELMGNSPEICRKHYAALIPKRMRNTVEFDIPASISELSEDRNILEMFEKILKKLQGKRANTE